MIVSFWYPESSEPADITVPARVPGNLGPQPPWDIPRTLVYKLSSEHLKRGLYRRLYRVVLQGLLRGIQELELIAHIRWVPSAWYPQTIEFLEIHGKQVSARFTLTKWPHVGSGLRVCGLGLLRVQASASFQRTKWKRTWKLGFFSGLWEEGTRTPQIRGLILRAGLKYFVVILKVPPTYGNYHAGYRFKEFPIYPYLEAQVWTFYGSCYKRRNSSIDPGP